MLHSAKWNFLNNLSTNLRSPKQFWSAYHSLSANYQRIPWLLTNGSYTVESPSAKVNMLNSYFTSNFSTSSNLLSTLFNLSNITLVYKDGDPKLASNYTLPSPGSKDVIQGLMPVFIKEVARLHVLYFTFRRRCMAHRWIAKPNWWEKASIRAFSPSVPKACSLSRSLRSHTSVDAK